jgi:hypothetical protein
MGGTGPPVVRRYGPKDRQGMSEIIRTVRRLWRKYPDLHPFLLSEVIRLLAFSLPKGGRHRASQAPTSTATLTRHRRRQ